MRSFTAAFAAVMLAATIHAEDNMVKLKAVMEKREFKSSKGHVLPYRLMQPERYDHASQKAYPLVIFLHGAGERGNDNEAQLVEGVPDFATAAARKQFPCFLIAPQCPKNQGWASGVRMVDKKHIFGKEPTPAMAALLELLEQLPKEFHLDPQRIYITGLSMGGYGTWDLLARRPDYFAAAVPVCGGGDADTVTRFVKTPIWIFHGAKDDIVKPERSRIMFEALLKAGGHPGYTEYPDVSHDSWTMTYHNPDVLKWLFAQKKP